MADPVDLWLATRIAELEAEIQALPPYPYPPVDTEERRHEVVKIKPYDKLKALEMLAKHLGLLTERVEHSGGLEVSWKDSEGE